MKNRKLCLFLSILILCCGCSPKEKNISQNTLKINLKDEPQTLDPRQIRETSGLTLMKMFFEGLTRIGLSDAPELALAQGVEISEDLKTYTFYLREALWSNGDPVEAGDFVYSWQSSLRPDFRSDTSFQLYPIKNAKAIKCGEKPLDALGAQALDAKTLIVQLEYPLPYFLELLSLSVFFPVNRHIAQQNESWAQQVSSYVCNGPFALCEWKHQYSLCAKKNPSYWDAEKVRLDAIEMAMVPSLAELELYETKKLHWAGAPISGLPLDCTQSLKKVIQKRAILGTAFVQMNVQKKLLGNQKLRHALALAVDREEISQHLLSGNVASANQFVPPSFGLAGSSCFQESEKALQLFEQALQELGLTRDSFPSLVFTHVAAERSCLIAQTLQEQWRRALGISVKLDGVERKVFFDRLSRGDYEVVYRDWIADYNDPVNFLEIFKYRGQSTNNSGWEDPKYAQLIDSSFTCADAAERKAILARSERILLDAMPIIPLFHHHLLYLKDEKLEGVFLSSLGHLDFKWAYWNNAK